MWLGLLVFSYLSLGPGVKAWAELSPKHLDQIPPRVMALYRQRFLMANDPLSEMALIRGAELSGQRTWLEFTGRKSQAAAFAAPTQAEIEMAQQLFGEMSRPPRPERPRRSPQPWSPSVSDFEQLNRLRVTAEQRGLLIKKLFDGSLALEGRTPPIQIDGFVRMFQQIMREEKDSRGTQPILGRPHVWTRAFLEKYRRQFDAPMKLSRLLLALANGLTSLYLVTGSEDLLLEWMLAQEDGAIDPASLLRESYRLNFGNVYLTLLTIENVLSEHWRIPNRDDLEMVAKLRPITQRVGKGIDTFGAWYHFFGLALYSYVEGASQARAVAHVEDAMSALLSGFVDETQEHFINLAGADVGQRLREAVVAPLVPPHPQAAAWEAYMAPVEDFGPRLLKYLD